MPTGYLVPTPQWVSAKATVVAQAATADILAADVGKQHTNTGASGTIVLTLPSAPVVPGSALRIQVTAAQIVQVDPVGTEKAYLGGSGVAGKHVAIAGVIGNFADFYSDGVDWMVTNYSGVLTKEA